MCTLCMYVKEVNRAHRLWERDQHAWYTIDRAARLSMTLCKYCLPALRTKVPFLAEREAPEANAGVKEIRSKFWLQV